MKYIDWLNTWLEYYVKPQTKLRTYYKYSEIAEVHIVPYLGNLALDEIDAVTLQKFTVELSIYGNSKTHSKLASSTVNSIISVVQSSLRTAVSTGVVAEQHSDSIARPRFAEKQVDCFTEQEQKAIEQFILHNKKTRMYGVIFSLYTGLRLGELLALEWQDIDFISRTMTISKSCHYGKDNDGHFKRIVETPKTPNSQRIIPLPKSIVLLLKEIKILSKSPSVISNKDNPICVRSYQRSFELLLKKLNIPHKGFHALRHTFATRAISCGMDVKTLSEILGHKNTNITLNRYVHSPLPHKINMMNKLGKLLNLE